MITLTSMNEGYPITRKGWRVSKSESEWIDSAPYMDTRKHEYTELVLKLIARRKTKRRIKKRHLKKWLKKIYLQGAYKNNTVIGVINNRILKAYKQTRR